LRVAIVAARFNAEITARLVAGAERGLAACGCAAERRLVIDVAGAFELPQAVRHLARGGAHDAIVALGAVVRGETAHAEYVAAAASQGLIRVALDCGVPVTFGVLTTDTPEQALARAGDGEDNKGFEAAVAAVELAALFAAGGRPRGRR